MKYSTACLAHFKHSYESIENTNLDKELENVTSVLLSPSFKKISHPFYSLRP